MSAATATFDELVIVSAPSFLLAVSFFIALANVTAPSAINCLMISNTGQNLGTPFSEAHASFWAPRWVDSAKVFQHRPQTETGEREKREGGASTQK